LTAPPLAFDAFALTRHGIPSLSYGATRRTRALSDVTHCDARQSDGNPQRGERASIADMVDATKV
jgi:hypothetical protein